MPTLVVRAPIVWAGPGMVIDDGQVVCRGPFIESVGPREAASDLAEIVEVDAFLMPSGADRHVHVGLGDPAAILRGGVTAVRDLAWPAEAIFPLAEASELPGFDGPLIAAAGPMLTVVSGYPLHADWAPAGCGLVVEGPDQAAAAVRNLAGQGAAAIKVNLNSDAGPTPGDGELAAICDAARELSIPVTAHAQGVGEVERALGAGVDELAHTPWTERLTDDVIEMVAARMRIVSTLDIHSHGARTPELEVALDNLRRFHAAGGRTVYGTDLGNGPIPPGVHVGELRLLREAGLATEEVADALVRAPLEPGAPADLIGLGESPLGDVAAFEDLRLVIRSGRLV